MRSADPSPRPGDGKDYIFVAAGVDNPVTHVQPRAVTAQTRTAGSDEFTWYDGTRPLMLDTLSTAVQPVYVDSWSMWPHDGAGNIISTQNGVLEPNVRQMADMVIEKTDTLVIDIEHWPMDIRVATPAQVDRTIADFKQIIDWVRDEQPTLKIGIYGMFPIADLYRATGLGLQQVAAADPGGWYEGNLPTILSSFAGWQAANEYLRPLADDVDVIFPSLYTRTTHQQFWTDFSIAVLDEAQRYGKPVVPFVWARYHNSMQDVGNQLIDQGFWQHQLETIRDHADGVVAWMGESFDPAIPWSQTYLTMANNDDTLFDNDGGRSDSPLWALLG